MEDDQRVRFEGVYSDTYEQILGYVMRRCDSPEDAADVVAETFTIAWRRVDSLPPGGEAKLWLFGVARRVLANHRRDARQRLNRNVELRDELTRLYGTVPSPENRPDLRVIGQVFRDLPDRDRELISLLVWEELDHSEMAKVLGCSRNAVSVRLHRARKRLSRALAKAGIEPIPGQVTIDALSTEETHCA